MRNFAECLCGILRQDSRQKEWYRGSNGLSSLYSKEAEGFFTPPNTLKPGKPWETLSDETAVP